MKRSFTSGIGFGLTSGVITTLGLLVGLYSGTRSMSAVLSGIVIIAIADSLSDSMGMHISSESNKKHSERAVWETTVTTFLVKFVTAISFVLPLILFPLPWAILVSIMWGFLLVACFSILVAEERGENAVRAVVSHLLITIAVIVATYFIGVWLSGVVG